MYGDWMYHILVFFTPGLSLKPSQNYCNTYKYKLGTYVFWQLLCYNVVWVCVYVCVLSIVITMHCVTCFKNSAQGADVYITAARLSSEYYWVNEGAFNCAFIRYILALTVLKKLYCCSLLWSCSVHKEPYKVALWDIIDWCLTVFVYAVHVLSLHASGAVQKVVFWGCDGAYCLYGLQPQKFLGSKNMLNFYASGRASLCRLLQHSIKMLFSESTQPLNWPESGLWISTAHSKQCSAPLVLLL